LLVSDPAGAAPPRYEPRILDASRLGPFDGSFGQAGLCCFLNDGSQLIGTLRRDGFADVYVWDARTDTVEFLPVVSDVGSLPRLNRAGHVIGRLPGGASGFFWSPETGVVTFLEPPFTFGQPTALNDVSQVFVQRGLPDGSSSAVLWDPSGLEIPIEPGGAMDPIVDGGLNDLGQAVGSSETGAFFWDPVDGFRSPPLFPGSEFVEPVALNDAGQMAGYFYFDLDPNDESPFIGLGRFGAFWDGPDAVPIELPCEPVTTGLCDMLEVTERGQVFGQISEDQFFEFGGIVWTGNVPALVVDRLESPPGFELDGCNGIDINDLGQTSGFGTLVPLGDPDGGIVGPCILTPVPTVGIESPTPGATVDATELLVTGFATDEFEVASVVVNGVEAVLVDASDPDDPVKVAFEAVIPLVPGANEIVALATDVDGNTDEDVASVENEGAAGGFRPCDVNGDDAVDRADVDAIFAARESQPDGPDDPRDANGDGVLSINDARLCVLECDLPACETPPEPEPVCGLVGLELLLPPALLRRRRSPRTQGES